MSNCAAPSAKAEPVRCTSTVLTIRKGTPVVFRGRAAKVLAAVSPAEIYLSIAGTNEKLWVKAGDLSAHADPDDHSLEEVLPTIDEDELAIATAWVDQFDLCVDNDQLSTQHLTAIAERLDTSTRTVRRHLERYLQDPTPRNQLAWPPGPEKGQTYLPSAVEALIEKAIDRKYESKERGTIACTVKEAGRLCRAAGYSAPSYSAVYARIQRRDRWKAARRRHGRVRGDAKAGPAGARQDTGLKPLDVVEIDHAIVDVIVVDPITREEIGRPWITLAIDVASRCVVGFYLTFDDPSQTSVALALEHCCCPKDAWMAEIGVDDDWIPMGLMRTVGWDNAKSFKSSSLVTACAAIGIRPRFRRIRTPTHGAHIERFIGTYMGQLHMLKGTTFSNTKQREDYDSQKRACMSLEELIRWTTHQINGVYHNTKHSELGKTPLEAWTAGLTQEGEYRMPRYPADRRAFRLSLLPGVYRSVQRDGLHRFNLRYWDDALVPLIRDRAKYWIAHDPRNISRVYLKLDGRYIDVPWYDRSRRPCALFELDLAKKAAKNEHDAPYSEARVFEHLNELAAIEASAEHTTREQRRRNARRPKGEHPPSPSRRVVDYTKPPVLLANPLEV